MDLNNNVSSGSTKPVKVCFTNEIKVDIQIPKSDAKFNKFVRNEFKPFQNPLTNLRRRSSVIDSQAKKSSCLEQFTDLIETKLNESTVETNEKFKQQFKNPDILRETPDQLNSHLSGLLCPSKGELKEPCCSEDLKFYLFDLVLMTQRALISCNESQVINDDEPNSDDCSNVKSNCGTDSKGSKDSIEYLNSLDRTKLVVYREKLEETIIKLNNDLVNELKTRDSIYQRRDNLFIQIERLTDLCLQELNSSDNPVI